MYRLVIIDDEYIVVEGLQVLLKKLGEDCEVVGTAGDGQKGLELILREKPDVVITDIRIPYMDGLSMIEACREVLPGTRFIIISGYQEFEYARRALVLGALDYIDKPVTADKLHMAFVRLKESDRRREERTARITEMAEDSRSPEKAAFAEKPLEKNPGSGEGGRPLQSPSAGAAEASSAIEQINSYIHANYMHDIGLTELSDMVSMNPAYLSVLFKDRNGISFIKYLTRVRLEKARELLAKGAKTAEAAEAVGYHDAHYFSEIFKKNTGMTPSEYKDSLRAQQ